MIEKIRLAKIVKMKIWKELCGETCEPCSCPNKDKVIFTEEDEIAKNLQPKLREILMTVAAESSEQGYAIIDDKKIVGIYALDKGLMTRNYDLVLFAIGENLICYIS